MYSTIATLEDDLNHIKIELRYREPTDQWVIYVLKTRPIREELIKEYDYMYEAEEAIYDLLGAIIHKDIGMLYVSRLFNKK